MAPKTAQQKVIDLYESGSNKQEARQELKEAGYSLPRISQLLKAWPPDGASHTEAEPHSAAADATVDVKAAKRRRIKGKQSLPEEAESPAVQAAFVAGQWGDEACEAAGRTPSQPVSIPERIMTLSCVALVHHV